MLSYVRDLIHTRELLANLVVREIKGQYRRTVLGQLWSLINPIATMVVYSVVFGLIFRARPRPGDPSGLDIYPLWLMSGLLAWTFFARVVNSGLGSVVSNASLIKKVYFPRAHLPFASTLSLGFTWCIELGVLIVAITIFGGAPWKFALLLIPFMLMLAMFATGLAMLLAIFNVHFRDTKHIISIVLQMWMYLTPIIYPVSLVLDAGRKYPIIAVLYGLNPMAHFVEVFRNLLYDNRLPAMEHVLWCSGVGLVFFCAGFLVFARSERRLAELL